MSRNLVFSIMVVTTRWIIRLAVVVGILLCIATLFMAGIGGNGDISRQSLERVIGGMTGIQATVHDLKSYRVFPEFKMDFKNMTAVLKPQTGTEKPPEHPMILPDVILEQALFVQDSFQNLWGGPAISAASFQNLILRPGIFGPHALHLRSGNIEGPVDATAKMPSASFVMGGDYGGQAVTITVPLIAGAVGQKWYYRIDGTSDMSLKLGAFYATGRLNIQKNAIIFDPLEIKIAGKVLSGTVVIPRGSLDKNVGVALFKLKSRALDNPDIIQIDRFDDQVEAHVVNGKPGDLKKNPWPTVVRELKRVLKTSE